MNGFELNIEFVLLLIGFICFILLVNYLQNSFGLKFFKKRQKLKEDFLKKQKEYNKGLNIVYSKDTFFAFYGIKHSLSLDNNSEIEACQNGTDPRCIKAKNVGLTFSVGRSTEGEDYFLYIGESLGTIYYLDTLHIKVTNLENKMDQVKKQLAQIGFTQEPYLHLQMECKF